MSDDLDDVLRALSDSTRRRLFHALAEAPGMTTGELVQLAPELSRWGVMKHLAVLRAAGLVQTLHDGRRRRHFAESARLTPLREWLGGR